MKKIRNIVVGIVILVLILSLIPVPLKVERSMEGIRYDEGTQESFGDVHIEIDGWYFHYVSPVFKRNYFTGRFEVGEEVHRYTRYARLTFMKSVAGKEAGMHYYDEMANAFRWGGQIRQKGIFKEISIWNGDKDFISAPAKNVSEADRITKDLRSFFYEVQE